MVAEGGRIYDKWKWLGEMTFCTDPHSSLALGPEPSNKPLSTFYTLVQGIEVRTLCMPGEHLNAELHPQIS